MNVLLITPKLIGGGAERIISLIASELSQKHNVIIACHFDDGRYDINKNVRIDVLNIPQSKSNTRRVINLIIAIRKIRKIKKDYAIDSTISFQNSQNIENVLSKVSDKTIASIRNFPSARLSGIKKVLAKYVGKRADAVVCLSNGVRIDQISNFCTEKSKCFTIYNPCPYYEIKQKSIDATNDEYFENIRKKAEYLFITAGRCVIEKGQWHLIKAFGEVARRHDNIHLIILGEGNLEEYLNKTITKLNLNSKVHLLGFKKNIYSYLSRCDCFLFSSISEGFGNVLLEAMACDLPIISTDCKSGPRELLAPNSDYRYVTSSIEYAEYGILTPVFMEENLMQVDCSKLTKEEEKYSEAIDAVINNDSLLKIYREKSKQRIMAFSVEEIISKWEEIIQ